MKKFTGIKIGLICFAVALATNSQASAQQFEFVDGSGTSLFELSYSALPGNASDVSGFEFTPAGTSFFGLTGSENFQSIATSATTITSEMGLGDILTLTDTGPGFVTGTILFAPDSSSPSPFDDRLNVELNEAGGANLRVGSQSVNGTFNLSVSAVPEPTCLALGLAGAIGMFTRRRRA